MATMQIITDCDSVLYLCCWFLAGVSCMQRQHNRFTSAYYLSVVVVVEELLRAFFAREHVKMRSADK